MGEDVREEEAAPKGQREWAARPAEFAQRRCRARLAMVDVDLLAGAGKAPNSRRPGGSSDTSSSPRSSTSTMAS